MARRLIIFTILAALLFCSGNGIQNAAALEDKMMSSEQIRESVIAGTWYPGNASRLRQEVEGFLDRVSGTDLQGQLVALISPHAGYRYSGQVIAYRVS